MKKNNNIIYIFLIVIFTFCAIKVRFQNDTFFSIAIGKEVANNGIDMIDHLSWHENLYYTYSHWAYDLINYTLYKYIGLKGIYFFTIFICISITLFLYHALKKLNDNNMLLSFLCTSFMIFLGSGFFTSRAQIISYLLFAIEIYCIENIIKSYKLRYFIILLIIPVIIANCHAAVWFMYFIFYLPYFAEHILNKYFKLNGESEKVISKEISNIKILVLIFIISILSGFLTPIGSTPFTYPFKTMFDGVSYYNISELQSPSLMNYYPYFVFAVSFFVLLMFNNCKIRLYQLLLILGELILGAISIRNSGFLFFTGIYVIAYLINFTIKEKLKEKNIEIKNIIETEELFNNKMKALLVFLASILSIGEFFSINIPFKFVNERSYPVSACDYICNNLDVDNIRLYNEFDFGSYVEYRGIKSFIDSRSEMYTRAYNDTDVYQDFINVIKGKTSYMECFEKYKITHVLVPKESLVETYISCDDGYKELYSDEYFVLYEVKRLETY